MINLRKGPAALSAVMFLILTAGCTVPSAVTSALYLDNSSVSNVSLAAVPDGTYSGDYTLVLPPGSYAMYRHFVVAVTVTGAAYSAITISEPAALAGSADFLALIDRIKSNNSLLVDGVSGATFSSRSMLKAVEKSVTR